MSFYTYATHGFGVLPDGVMEFDTLEAAVMGFFGQVDATCEYKGVDLPADLPADLPTEDDVIDALAAGTGLAYAAHGWIHAIGAD